MKKSVLALLLAACMLLVDTFLTAAKLDLLFLFEHDFQFSFLAHDSFSCFLYSLRPDPDPFPLLTT